MKVVILSAGHSNTDPGAVSGGLREAIITKSIVQMASDLLRYQSIGVLNVPDDLNLYGTIQWINKNCPTANLAVEVHVNAGGGKGLEGWFYHNSDTSKKVTETILTSMVGETGMVNRGAKDEAYANYGRLGFVHDTKPLATLIECGFIDNADDREFLNSVNGLYRLALGLAKGVTKHLGMAWKEPELQKDPVAQAILSLKGILAEDPCDCSQLKKSINQLLLLLKL